MGGAGESDSLCLGGSSGERRDLRAGESVGDVRREQNVGPGFLVIGRPARGKEPKGLFSSA